MKDNKMSAACNGCRMTIWSNGGNNINMLNHLSIHLQGCPVWDSAWRPAVSHLEPMAGTVCCYNNVSSMLMKQNIEPRIDTGIDKEWDPCAESQTEEHKHLAACCWREQRTKKTRYSHQLHANDILDILLPGSLLQINSNIGFRSNYKFQVYKDKWH